MEVELEDAQPLTFDDGSPVRAASGVAPLGNGFLVVQDDATLGALVTPGSVRRVRLLPPVDGLDSFDEVSGTKHLKPDLEAACAVSTPAGPAVLVLGSGSSEHRMRWSLVTTAGGAPEAVHADLTPLYGEVARALGIGPEVLNLEGASVYGDRLRWFHRGLPSAGVRSGSVDLDLGAALATLISGAVPRSVAISGPRHYDLGEVDGVGLAVTDSVHLPDGRLLVSAAAEDSPNVRDDGPVVGSALVLLDDDRVLDSADLPRVAGEVTKIEGLMFMDSDDGVVRLRGVVDGDDASAPSLVVQLRVSG